MYKVSIVIVNWNTKDLLIDCIRPLYGIDYIQIIVVDNNSTDGSAEVVNEIYPNVVLIANKYNPGFAKANNQGFKYCQGDNIFILNPDTICYVKDLDIMIRALDSDSTVGAVGPRILYGNGIIQKSCARKLPSLSAFTLLQVFHLNSISKGNRAISKYLKYPYSYEESSYVEAISGAAMLVRKNIIEKLKGFSEDFIHTGEDVELCYRIRESGYKILYIPTSTIIHFAGQSSKQAIIRVSVNTYLSSFQYFKKTKGLLTAITFKLILYLFKVPIDLLGNCVLFLSKRKKAQDVKDQFYIAYYLYRWKEVIRS